MKVHRWIDKYNYKVSFRIIKKYSSQIANGGSVLYALHPLFWKDYLLRILLVLSSIITIKKTAYKNFYSIISCNSSPFFSRDKNPALYIKLRDLISTLFGYRYFVEEETLPLLGSKTVSSKHITFKSFEKPSVSVIINNVTRLDYLYNCLQSLQDNISDQHPYEVIVINRTNDSDIKSFLKDNVKGISLQDVALPAVTTKGDLIYLLSSDTQIKRKSIAFLIETLKNKAINCAGGKLVSKNGLLLSAGDQEFFEDPNHPDFNYQQEVTICRFNNLIIRKDYFSTLNLTNNIPAIYQPLSEAICFNDLILKKDSLEHITLNKEPHYKTILFIDDIIPTPDQDSGSNRIFKIMQLVKALGYHVMFLPANGEKKAHYFEQMVLEGFEVLYRFPNRKGMIQILMTRLHRIDMVWLCKPHNNEQFKFLFEKKKDLRWIYDTIDLHFLRLQREGELSKDDNLIQSANAIKLVELDIAKHADLTIAITNDEQIILQKEQINNVAVIPNIHEMKTTPEEAKSFSTRNGLLFIGGYLHKPNIDAAEWLVKEIMPIIWEQDPSITLTLLGSSPTKEVLALQSARVIVPGYIHDVSSYFNNNRIFVAPLRFGAGMKGKIGQSLEFGLPIVSTNIGVEGIGLTDGHDVIVANDTIAFAEKIMQLYSSPELWTEIRNNSINVLKAYTPEVVKQQLDRLLKTIN
ncbi:glycosyltransferase [Pedobacter hiemivivus]|uniref:Glycosyltransferase n=1 Tax=Pedobacter hiemivivus TaxID=2530454 RepID=A0A4R0NFW3_9SPHI|nr:glycosyltransferase [Pedobacter hiemivivus]TCC97564.1 glycosyltransferase [Pedobacter hiemivivus]